MKRTIIIIIVFSFLNTGFCQKKTTGNTVANPSVQLLNSNDSMQYILGAFIAQWINNNGFVVNNAALFSKGANDVFKGVPRLVPDSILGPSIAAYQRSVQKERAIEQEKQLFNALRDKPGVGQLPNGVRFVVLKSGKGVIPSEKDSIVLHMVAKLIDGTKVEDTYQSNKPFSATINSFFPGLNDALTMMPEGAKWQLFVPAILAYGENGTSLIPPNSVLILDVELVSVKRNAKS